MTTEVRLLGDAIVRTHDGQMMFNLAEVSKIVGKGRNSIAGILHEAGILVKKCGRDKNVNAYQLAEFMCKDRIAPID